MENRMKHRTKYLNKTVAIILIIFLSVSIIGGITYAINSNNNNIAEAEESLLTQTQAMNGVDKNIAFEFTSDETVTSDNWTNFVDIKNINGNVPECVFEEVTEKKFLIKAPISGYEAGGNYVIQLKDAQFTQDGIDSETPFYFSIYHKKIENVEFASNVIEVNKENIIDFNGKKLVT